MESPTWQLGSKFRCPPCTVEVVRLEAAGLLTSRTVGRNPPVAGHLDHPAREPITKLLKVTFGPRAVIADECAISGADKGHHLRALGREGCRRGRPSAGAVAEGRDGSATERAGGPQFPDDDATHDETVDAVDVDDRIITEPQRLLPALGLF